MVSQEYADSLPPRGWISNRSLTHIILGAVLSIIIIAAASASALINKTFISAFLTERGSFQPIMLSISLTLLSYAFSRRRKIKKEFTNTSRNWLFKKGEFNSPGEALNETIIVLSARKDILANRQLRILQTLRDTGSRSIAKEVHDEDASLTDDEISQSFYIPKMLIWALPMIGFLGTVTGISDSVSGFSGLIENAANINLIKQSLQAVMGGLATAFDTTILGIISALIVTLLISLTEKSEFNLSQAVNSHINDKLFVRINPDGTFE
jgi:biopolymer transport protein ExbB/TolQ